MVLKIELVGAGKTLGGAEDVVASGEIFKNQLVAYLFFFEDGTHEGQYCR